MLTDDVKKLLVILTVLATAPAVWVLSTLLVWGLGRDGVGFGMTLCASWLFAATVGGGAFRGSAALAKKFFPAEAAKYKAPNNATWKDLLVAFKTGGAK
jgi:hypothetical protein